MAYHLLFSNLIICYFIRELGCPGGLGIKGQSHTATLLPHFLSLLCCRLSNETHTMPKKQRICTTKVKYLLKASDTAQDRPTRLSNNVFIYILWYFGSYGVHLVDISNQYWDWEAQYL